MLFIFVVIVSQIIVFYTCHNITTVQSSSIFVTMLPQLTYEMKADYLPHCPVAGWCWSGWYSAAHGGMVVEEDLF